MFVKIKHMNEKNKQITTERFVITANLIHRDKYDYSLSNYINVKIKLKIICKKHGIFEQTPDKHINGKQGCPQCVGKNKTKEIFIIESNLVHNNKFDYSLFEYKGSCKKSIIICPKGHVFKQDPHNHKKGRGCPICRESKGEVLISNWLINNNIKFIKQYRFNGCRNKNPLPFDFYLPKYDICIEFDGRHHFEIISEWGGIEYLLDVQKKDAIKTNYCEENDIQLIRIKYTENISEILTNKLNYVC